MKKSLIFWFPAVTCAALFLVGCESPTNGEAGAAGSPGSVTFSGDVTAAELAKAFAKSNEVILQSTVTSVYGVIPTGKTLAVFGSGTKVTDAQSLEVAGALEIETGAALNASYTGAAGYLKGTAANVKGAGTVKLPFVGTGGSLPTDGIGYETAGVAAVRAVGSYITGAAPGSALDSDGIAAIFTDAPEITELTVSGITGLTDVAVPSGKTLTLTGPSNTFTAALDLSTAKGTLIVDGTLTDSTGVAITAHSTTSNITINGTLALHASSTVVGKVTNNGTITSATTAQGTQKALLELTGAGKVVLSGIGGDAVHSATLTLGQNVEIANGGKLLAPVQAAPFSGGKTITISGTGVLDLGAVATTSFGATIVNNGAGGGGITTATTSDTALQTIVNLGGAITSTGNVASTAAFTVPVGTTLTHNTGTFVGGSGALTIDGEATFTTGTFESQTGAVTINGTAEFTLATFAGLTGTVTINGAATFSAAAVPGGNVTVAGTLTVPTGGSLTIVAGKALDIAADGVVALTGTGSLVLKGATATDGAKLTGAGKLTAGKTEIVGGTGGWQAVGGSGDITITSVSAVTATITAASSGVLTAQGAGATITQLPGAGNALTIAAATTVALNNVGSITLTGASTNGAKIAFAQGTTSVITTGASGTSGNDDSIAGITATSVTFVSNDSDNKLVSITSKNAATPNLEVGSTDVTIDKNTVVSAAG